MVILFGVMAVLVVLIGVVWRFTRSPGRDNHGAMSEQWLAEHRASHHRPLGD